MNYSFSDSNKMQEQLKRRFLIFGSENYLEHKSLFDEVCCQKCFELTLKMRQCKTCSKIYCSNCFDPQQAKMYCPNCGCNEEILIPNQKLMTLNQILFKCRYYTNGCQTKLNIESLFCHEEQCNFQKNVQNLKQLLQSSQSVSSSLTNSYQEGPKQLSTNNYASVRHPYTDVELVPMALFKDLLKELAVLKQVCAVNFKKRCNNGHELIYETRDANITREVVCDVCKQLPSNQSVGSYRCEACDFDRCEQCYLQSRLF
ncbi:hypothetical protein TTHERM_00078890 (macronuclear) [Tetrahymena thermophila SB210]|uniref:Uncharacterized protein n=1 Tax=Tetrahymena thermophila (strain SB210) TaxID=312017 RepID=Q23FX5_TETTS|nr:hypothetical protein TTHERM_00078890 [Tetrahymena thermophila SB210]EAR95485.2 hypothetical protein TTHERM_00078890 [Tetrahymena thermophila SB210]|eukprot:XP_001015730.2 hypothetical protein TTHERM_00078890 [Tetrahymena thermophila SB210]